MKHPSKTASGRSSGFTLIEMVVVIGLIGCLAAITLPMCYGARQRALAIACANNLSHIGQAYVAHRLDYPTGADSQLVDKGWVQELLPYLGNEKEALFCPVDPTPACGQLELATVAVYSYDGVTHLLDIPVRAREGWVKRKEIHHSRYELWFEDGVDTDFNDIALRVDERMDRTVRVTVISRDAGYHFDLIELPARNVLLSRLGEGANSSVILSEGVSSYGMNSQAAGLTPGQTRILAMDYEKTIVESGSDGEKDSWAAWYNDDGYRFARHEKQCNVLFADGSVRLTGPEQLRPDHADAVKTYWNP